MYKPHLKYVLLNPYDNSDLVNTFVFYKEEIEAHTDAAI